MFPLLYLSNGFRLPLGWRLHPYTIEIEYFVAKVQAVEPIKISKEQMIKE